MDIFNKRNELLHSETDLIIEALNYFSDTHAELQPIISKLSQNIFSVTEEETNSIWTVISNYFPLLSGTKRKGAMYIAVCFDPYASEIQSNSKNFE